MSLTPEEVDHIALLARLDHVARLQKLDTSHIAPTSSVLPPRSRLREDKIKTGLSKDQALQNAPDEKRGQFRVPPVLDR
jgi:aspartyl-tRNA(Asn)/glutamyl-tRNA(Gln) amidotransferase subunit C